MVFSSSPFCGCAVIVVDVVCYCFVFVVCCVIIMLIFAIVCIVLLVVLAAVGRRRRKRIRGTRNKSKRRKGKGRRSEHRHGAGRSKRTIRHERTKGEKGRILMGAVTLCSFGPAWASSIKAPKEGVSASRAKPNSVEGVELTAEPSVLWAVWTDGACLCFITGISTILSTSGVLTVFCAFWTTGACLCFTSGAFTILSTIMDLSFASLFIMFRYCKNLRRSCLFAGRSAARRRRCSARSTPPPPPPLAALLPAAAPPTAAVVVVGVGVVVGVVVGREVGTRVRARARTWGCV